MKKRILICSTTIGALAIPLLLFSFSISKIVLDNEHKTNTLVSSFSYQQGDERVGFEHITFQQNNVYNPRTSKYEYFLNQAGKKYLIDRFMETSVIGPEISSLRYIVIGDTGKENVGKHYVLANAIYVNPFPFLKNQKNQLWQAPNQTELQKKRAEILMHILVHEYGHHFFDAYASSPIGYSQHFSSPLSNVKMIYSRGKKVGVWNKAFYNQFRQLFFNNGVVPRRQYFKYAAFNHSLLDYEKFLHNGKQGITPEQQKKWGEQGVPIAQLFQSITKQLQKYRAKKTLYGQFTDVGALFKMANESKTWPWKPTMKDDVEFALGIKINNYAIPWFLSINYKELFYYYSIVEQATRKLLLSIFIPTESDELPHLGNKYLYDNFFSSDYVNYQFGTKKQQNNWYHFYSDNVYPSAHDEARGRGVNRSQALIKNIIRPLIGYDNHSNRYSNLSFITYNRNWNVLSGIKDYISSAAAIYDDYQKIKIGGYMNNNDYNYIGYINSQGHIVKFPIQVKNFKIWYKHRLEGQKVNVNNDKIYYWYAQAFIDAQKIMNQKLFFFHFDGNNKIKQQALNSIRKNDYGIANSFNVGMSYDQLFIKNVMNKVGPNSKWLIVADDTGAGVQLKYYAQQEAVEHIWR